MRTFTMKCPCCGAELLFGADGITLSCEYCGHREYWKEEKTEKLISALDRANALRRASRFSDAIMEYKLIIEQNPEDAEAHWGLVTSLYGIEFVKDPRTNRYTPTCHRAVRESILENADYLKAVQCASREQGEDYRKQALEIERLQKEILKLSDAEEEYDVFISFKSTDEMGRITRDAQIARIIYDELTKRGVKTFFSDVTLEGKLFSAYEPIIFRALFSCKFFILVGTKDEFINAPWVKNEWSRFAERMENERLSGVACAVFDGAQVTLPPFVRAQGIDLRRYAAGGYEIHVADAVEKKLGRKKRSREEEAILQQIEAQKKAQRELEERLKGIQQGGASAPAASVAPSLTSLLIRARQELEARNWDKSVEYYNRVLDADPQNADAWWGLFLADMKAVRETDLYDRSFTDLKNIPKNRNYINAQKYALGNSRERFENFRDKIGAQMRENIANVLKELPRDREWIQAEKQKMAKREEERRKIEGECKPQINSLKKERNAALNKKEYWTAESKKYEAGANVPLFSSIMLIFIPTPVIAVLILYTLFVAPVRAIVRAKKRKHYEEAQHEIYMANSKINDVTNRIEKLQTKCRIMDSEDLSTDVKAAYRKAQGHVSEIKKFVSFLNEMESISKRL